MADNLAWTPGSGATIAADDCAGVHYQRIKLVDGTDNSTAVIAGDSTWGLDVDVTRLPSSSSATLANVSSSASSVTIVASNSARKGLIIFNDSTQVLRIKYGATASSTSFTDIIYPNTTWFMVGQIYTGIIDGIWASANGSARYTEW